MTTDNTELLKIAASLVLGKHSMPYHQEDYDKRVPKWILKEFEGQRNNHRLLSIRIKGVYDNLRQREIAQTKREQELEDEVLKFSNAFRELQTRRSSPKIGGLKSTGIIIDEYK